jgi:sodium-dependent phosphate cotransporter
VDISFRRLEDAADSKPVLALAALAAVLLFLFAVQLLGTSTETFADVLGGVLDRVVTNEPSALGFAWLVTYVLTNGSVVAALSLSLFSTDLVTASQLYLMIAGSRLGGAGFVVVVGVLDYVQKERYSFRKAVSMGVLTFLLTYSVYVPATLFGWLLLPRLQPAFRGWSREVEFAARSLNAFDPATVAVTRLIGGGPAFLLALGVLFASLHLFDRVLSAVPTEDLRQYVFQHFERKWVSLGLGLVVTGVTTSVAFSLGVVVPLYNRNYVKRREIVPYVLGANLGTLFDTLVVSVVLNSPTGVAVVLTVIGTATLATLVAMVGYDWYPGAVERTQDRILEDRRVFLAFALTLVLVPIAFLAIR